MTVNRKRWKGDYKRAPQVNSVGDNGSIFLRGIIRLYKIKFISRENNSQESSKQKVQ